MLCPDKPYLLETKRVIKTEQAAKPAGAPPLWRKLSLAAGPEFMNALPPPERRKHFNHAFAFAEPKIGKGKVIAAAAHIGRKTPHTHLSSRPITPEKKLSAKVVSGYQARMSRGQNDYSNAIFSRRPEPERGISTMETEDKRRSLSAAPLRVLPYGIEPNLPCPSDRLRG